MPRRMSNQFANVLGKLGIAKGDRVFCFMDRVPELYAAVFGTLKAGCVTGPLFSAFGPDAAGDRLADAGAKVLVTSPDQRAKVAAMKPNLPDLKHIIIVEHGKEPVLEPGELSWNDLIKDASGRRTTSSTPRPEDPAVMHYTSGTTGKSKGAVHVHQAVLGHYATGKYVLDLHPDDIYWCTADPGWVTGTSYGMFAPHTNGVTSVIYEGGFSANKWYDVIQRHKVTVWYTAPTAIRLLMKAGDEVPKKYDLSSLRYTMSVGEPLNPEAVVWSRPRARTAVPRQLVADGDRLDHDRQLPDPADSPGSMGKPMPGIEPGIIDERGQPQAAGRRRRPRAAAGLAIDVPDVLEQRVDVRLQVQERLVHHRRPRPHGRRRLLLVHRPLRRRHQHRRPPRRPVRGRERADRASGRCRGWRHRQARPGGDGDRQGVRDAEGRLRALGQAPRRAAAVQPQEARPRRRAA